MHQGCPIDRFLKISVLQANFCWLGDLEEVISLWMESVAWKTLTVGVCLDLMCRISGMSFFVRNFPSPYEGVTMPPPPSPTEGLNFVLWPHPNWLKVPGDTSAGNFPVSQVMVISCRYTLLAWNSSISLAGSEKQINSSQQSPKMLNMDSESSIHGLLLFLGLLLGISRWVPLMHL